MRTLAALAVATFMASVAEAAPMKDPTKLSWVTGAADALRADAPLPSPRIPSPQVQPAQAAGTPAASTGEPTAFTQGRLAHVLRERKLSIKKVWRERRAKPRSDAPQRKTPAR